MLNIQQKRLLRRVVTHHLLLITISGAFILLLYPTLPGHDPIWKWSLVTAYASLILLSVTLLMGPWNILRGHRNPVSRDLRRDVGIWAAILGVVHTVIGLDVHLRGRPWLYFIYPRHEIHWIPLRHDLFGLANDTGFIGTMILLLLLATSNDLSLRRLGTPRWKSLQRWNYFLFLFVALHGAAYQSIEKQRMPFVVTLVLCVAVLQMIGFFMQRKTKLRTSPSSF